LLIIELLPKMTQEKQLIALVTGATGGLGTDMVKKLTDDGYKVAGTYNNPAKAEAWSERMKAEGYDIPLYQVDVADFDDTGRMVEQVAADWGTIDILVNNAGITRDGAFYKMTKQAWDEVIGTNLTSVFNCTRHVINPMIQQQWGRVINISSVNGQRAQFGQANYSAAKAGMHGFTKTLAIEVAKKGVTVNTISPGYIGTDMVMAVPENIREQIVSGIPVGRLGGTDEIAWLVSFLASKHAAFITGANIAINGGQHVY
jgi:acetoacetyl-CoA reductase